MCILHGHVYNIFFLSISSCRLHSRSPYTPVDQVFHLYFCQPSWIWWSDKPSMHPSQPKALCYPEIHPRNKRNGHFLKMLRNNFLLYFYQAHRKPYLLFELLDFDFCSSSNRIQFYLGHHLCLCRSENTLLLMLLS